MPRLIVLILLLLTSWQISAEVRRSCVSTFSSTYKLNIQNESICHATATASYDEAFEVLDDVQDDMAQDNSLILFMLAIVYISNYFIQRVRSRFSLGIDSYTNQLLNRPPIQK